MLEVTRERLYGGPLHTAVFRAHAERNRLFSCGEDGNGDGGQRVSIAVPIFFELEPTGVNGTLEANGYVHYFCSVTCRNRFQADESTDTDYAPGTDANYLFGTLCEMCARKISV